MTKKRNKQHDARGASFKRLARELRVQAKLARFNGSLCNANLLLTTARAFETECRTLRAMR
jgi:hypothetical protein